MANDVSAEEKAKILMQVDHFVTIAEERSGLTFSEIVEILKWARSRKNFYEQLQTYSIFTVAAALLSALMLALWAGVKELWK